MKEAAFISRNKDKWKEMEAKVSSSPDLIATQFIELTDDLAYASTFYPGSDTESYLHGLTRTKFLYLYRNNKFNKNSFSRFWLKEIPSLIYTYYKDILLATAIFLVAVFIGAFSAANDYTFVRLVLGDYYVDVTLHNIEKGDPMAIYKSFGATDGFLSITFNNIRVAFFAFVSGVFIAIGSCLVLINNGIVLGAFQYFFYQKGLLITSVLSVWIHGTIEITSIIIAGGAGIIMGKSLLMPGSFPRGYSFKKGATAGVKIVVSLVPFFIIAGFLEGFVTRHTFMPAGISISIIILSLLIIIAYFVLLPLKFISKQITHTNGKNQSA
jgi:uncharacterized membrane protein SpoIIM required for sporulation